VADPASETFYGMGRMASGIEVPFRGDRYYEVRNVPHGDIRIKRFYSNINKYMACSYIYILHPGTMRIQVKNTLCFISYMVVVKTSVGWASQGKTDLIIDNLIAEKKAVPMIVIMPDGNIPLNGFSEETLKVFENELEQNVHTVW